MPPAGRAESTPGRRGVRRRTNGPGHPSAAGRTGTLPGCTGRARDTRIDSPTPARDPCPIPVPRPTPRLAALISRHGEAERARVERGVRQVLAYWRPADGSPEDLRAFLETEFLPRGPALDAAFARFEAALERIHGHLLALARDLRYPIDVDTGPLTLLDERLATLDPFAHLNDDLFATKIAFAGLLNFPLTTLAERRAAGAGWSRREWAEARLAESFACRVPAEVAQRMTRALVAADAYINGYDLHARGLVDEAGRRPFPDGLRLISHWGLRDEIKARYADPDGLAAQRLLQRALERIVAQEIPASVPGNPAMEWNPFTNAVRAAADARRAPAAATPAPPQRTPAPPRRRPAGSLTPATRTGSPASTPRARPIPTSRPTRPFSRAASTATASWRRRRSRRS